MTTDGSLVESWNSLVRLQSEGSDRSIGLLIFNRGHIEWIIGETGVRPQSIKSSFTVRLGKSRGVEPIDH
jgi:hypothetical protein